MSNTTPSKVKRVHHYEISYLRLVARRLYQEAQKAKARGEEYKDIAQPTLLEAGYFARLRYTDEGLEALYIDPPGWAWVKSAPETRQFALDLATEILDGEAFMTTPADVESTLLFKKVPTP